MLKVIPHDAVNQIFDAARIVPGTYFRDDTTESGYVILKAGHAISTGPRSDRQFGASGH